MDASGNGSGNLIVGSIYEIIEVHSCKLGVQLSFGQGGADGPNHCWGCGCHDKGLDYWMSTRFRPLDLLSTALDRIEEESAHIEEPEPQHA